MIEEACTCEGLPAHSHIPTHWATVGGVYRAVFDDPFYVRIWVDWRQVARSFIIEGASNEPSTQDRPQVAEPAGPGDPPG